MKATVFFISILAMFIQCGGDSGSEDYLDLNVSPLDKTSLAVSWNGNNSKIKWKKDSGGPWNSDNVDQNPAGSTANNIWYYHISGLECNTKYKVKVRWKVRGWRTKYATTQNCGYIPCPKGGGFDSKNCQIGKAPEGTNAFIWGGNYYYTPMPGNQCPYPSSYFDGANCFVQAVPDGVEPFIHNNQWYYVAYP